ncbi:MAG: hypothetical protein JNK21_15385 [Rhodospirillaceae bacterium]|nr:hypothetical protein [Rhodospirillaceae bacterium]
MATPQLSAPKPVTAPSRGTDDTWGSVAHYRQEGGLHVIDVNAAAVAQLFSGLDPAPFRHKDMDPEVEGYITAALREIGDPSKAKLVIHLPAPEAESTAGHGLADAIHNYFSYRAWAASEDLKRLLRTGAVSLAIGISFLFLCLLSRQLLFGGGASAATTITKVLDEGLLIIGWVALWKPLEIALYEWWPLWRSIRRHRALKNMPIEVRGTDAAK